MPQTDSRPDHRKGVVYDGRRFDLDLREATRVSVANAEALQRLYRQQKTIEFEVIKGPYGVTFDGQGNLPALVW